LVLLAFYFNTRKVFPPDSILLLSMNIGSGLFMAVNTAYHHAYPSMCANTIWMLIALTGFYKQFKTSKR